MSSMITEQQEEQCLLPAPSTSSTFTVAHKEWFSTLRSPLLPQKWSILYVVNLRTLLADYLQPDQLADCCDPQVENSIALQRLCQHLIRNKNSQPFEAIVKYCEQKCEKLTELVNCLSIDLDLDATATEEGDPDAICSELTTKQFAVLVGVDGWLKLCSALDMNSMQDWLRQHFSQSDVKKLCSDLSNDEALARLHRMLLTRNSRSLYCEVVNLCQLQRDAFQECANFMKYGAADKGQGMDRMNALDGTGDFDHNEDFAMMKSQLVEMRHALFCAVQDAINQMRQLAKGNALEGSEVINLENDFQAMMDQCRDKILQLEHYTATFQNHQTLLAAALMKIEDLRVTNETYVARMTNLELVNSTNATKIRELNQKINELFLSRDRMTHLEDIASRISRAIPFTQPPSDKMRTVINNYKWKGLEPMECDYFGSYNVIDWGILGGDFDWSEKWDKIKDKENCWLAFRPVVLPREYGECVLLFTMDWKNRLQQLVIEGSIPTDTHKWLVCPPVMTVDLQITVTIRDEVIASKRDLLSLRKGCEWSLFMVVCDKVNYFWEAPKVRMKVFPLSCMIDKSQSTFDTQLR